MARLNLGVSKIMLTVNHLQVKGADHAVLDSYCRFLVTAGKALDIDIGGR